MQSTGTSFETSRSIGMTDSPATKHEADKPSTESLYRTRWLMAHNRFHSLVHRQEPANLSELKFQWQEYLDELNAAKEIASRPA